MKLHQFFSSVSLLYKFRDWNSSFHRRVLTDQELFFSSMNGFNDPFDSDIRINYEDLSVVDQLLLIKRQVEEENLNLSAFQKVSEIYRRFDDSALGDKNKLKEHYENYVKPRNETEIGILSLTGTKDNHLLWSHYANKHEGFCVAFNKDVLKEIAASYTLQGRLMVLEKVEYSKIYPNLNPAKLADSEYFKKPFTIKSDYWKYEEEERLIFRENGNVVLKFPKHAFAEIILGLKMPDKHRQEIIEIANEEFDNIKVFQAQKIDRSFHLNFIEL